MEPIISAAPQLPESGGALVEVQELRRSKQENERNKKYLITNLPFHYLFLYELKEKLVVRKVNY